jgi:FAD/FMN-containing dehydrogenase
MTCVPDATLLDTLERRLGPKGFTTDPADLAPWETDWRRRVAGKAAALLSPANTEEVADIVRLAAAARVAIVPQGGNTSMVAGAIPPEDGAALLLSLRRMNRIRSISADDNVAVAEAGVILSALHDSAFAVGRRFPLSLGARGSATIGGLVSTNAGGTQVLRFGNMRSLVLGIEAILPDGRQLDSLAALRKDNRGYDPRQLFVGAEGTLGVVTAASLRLVPAIGQRAVIWVGLADPRIALSLLREVEEQVGEGVESFELMPKLTIDLLLQHLPGVRAPLKRHSAWNVLIEVTAPAAAPDPGEALSRLIGDAVESGRVDDAVLASSEAQAQALWKLREDIPEAERADGPAVKHDIAVPVSAVPAFLAEAIPAVEGSFTRTSVIAFGHLGDGNIHFNVRPPVDVDRAGWIRDHGAAVSMFVHDLVRARGGTMSAEHGIGQTKLAEFVRTVDPVRLDLLRLMKRAIDPHGIMNPGKLIPADQVAVAAASQ